MAAIDFGEAIGKCITDGRIDEAIELIMQMNRNNAEIRFVVLNQQVVAPQPRNAQRSTTFTGNIGVYSKLIECGYSKELAEYAAQRCSTVEAAMEILGNMN